MGTVGVVQLMAVLAAVSGGIGQVLFHPKPSTANCTEHWFDQVFDHFSPRTPHGHGSTWSQLYYTYKQFWRSGSGPIFFYAGAEGPVTSGPDHYGFMWERAAEFKALLVFAEHRYYGASQPLGPDSISIDPSYLSTHQALADYAALIANLTTTLDAVACPVVVFGGSYGGMLAAYMRIKYPHLVAGAVASSAPVGAFPSQHFNPADYWKVVSECAGAMVDGCDINVRLAYHRLFTLGQDTAWRDKLSGIFRLCKPISSDLEVLHLALKLQLTFDNLAMGNYPYATDYFSDGPPWPAWPMKAACWLLGGSNLTDSQLLVGLGRVLALALNGTRTDDGGCFPIDLSVAPEDASRVWDYQTCTQMNPEEFPYWPANGVSDMFWDQGVYNQSAIDAHCQEAYGTTPNLDEMVTSFGGFNISSSVGNILFTNGQYDPWRIGGVLRDLSPTMVAIDIPLSAHHVDLMWPSPHDPWPLVAARKKITPHIADWVNQYNHQGATA